MLNAVQDDMVRFDTESARLVDGGRLVPDATWNLSAHMHPYWEFVYFVRGTGRIDIPNATLHPQPYHLVVYPPGLLHAEASSAVEPEQTIYLVVDVPGEWLAGTHILLPDPTNEIGWLFERITAEFLTHGTTPLADAYTRALLYLIERVRKSGVTVSHDMVDYAVQYMHTNYHTDIDLPTLTSIVSASESSLAHRFTEKLGISPLRYLQRIRIEAAKRLLSTTKLPISEVAARVGFADPLYFSRVFRRAIGCSPTEYHQRTYCAVQSISSAIPSIP